MLQVFRRLLFCGVLRNGEYSSERKPLYQVEYKESDDGDDVLYHESDPGALDFPPKMHSLSATCAPDLDANHVGG
ncbi:hypothetical protein NPIL_322741 [Nephila pilipes]|uniref:Uncharacterized protein n=1 Tax=Nephila pilipes TaxID=299642 RepID=A0A8X6UNL1_NEPPI|nr:hypothetical protein NPIL_322741 [Nephila pilipes]